MAAGLRTVPWWVSHLAALPLLLATAAMAASDAPGAAAERERLAAERQSVESRYVAEEAECRQRFIVTGCIDDAKQRRRAALAGLRQQELVLDDAERRTRAAQRQEVVDRKTAEAASRPAASASTPELRMPPASSPLRGAPADMATEPARRKTPDPEAARDAARRASAAEQRRLDGEAQRARIAAREAERAARGKPVAPLPLPAELAGSGAAR
jgi:colicin import membrane protein